MRVSRAEVEAQPFKRSRLVIGSAYDWTDNSLGRLTPRCARNENPFHENGGARRGASLSHLVIIGRWE